MSARFFDRPTKILFAMIVLFDIVLMTIGPRDALDIRLYYTGEQARALLASFDEAQIHRYFVNECIDLAFIMTYSALLFVCMQKYWRRYRVLAFLPGFFDLIETVSILIALSTPGQHDFFDWLGVATFLKWTTGAALVVAILLQPLRRGKGNV